MKNIKITLLSLVAIVGLMAFAPSYAGASPASQAQEGVKVAGGGTAEVCKNARGAVVDCFGQKVKTVTDVMFYIIGLLSVIMIIVGGIRYTVSNGDSSRVKAAKDTVTYAVVGLVVALLAFAIVSFVLKNV